MSGATREFVDCSAILLVALREKINAAFADGDEGSARPTSTWPSSALLRRSTQEIRDEAVLSLDWRSRGASPIRCTEERSRHDRARTRQAKQYPGGWQGQANTYAEMTDNDMKTELDVWSTSSAVCLT